jgi:hypothetical protein
VVSTLVRLELQQKMSAALVGTIHGVTFAMLGLLFVIFCQHPAGLRSIRRWTARNKFRHCGRFLPAAADSGAG